MLRLAVLFLVVALVAGLFGFGFVESAFMGIAKICFWVFVLLAVLSFLGGFVRTSSA